MTMVEKLSALLRSKGLTQSAFEAKALLSENRISKWKNGTGEPSAKEALRMARILEVPLEYLVDDEEDDPAPYRETQRDRQLREIIRLYGADQVYRRLIEVGVAPALGQPGASTLSAHDEAGAVLGAEQRKIPR